MHTELKLKLILFIFSACLILNFEDAAMDGFRGVGSLTASFSVFA